MVACRSGRYRSPDRSYCNSGGDAFGGGSVALGCGGLVAAGVGGGNSKSTDRVGEGKGRFEGFFVFELSFALSLIFTPPISLGLSLTSGDVEVLMAD